MADEGTNVTRSAYLRAATHLHDQGVAIIAPGLFKLR
jgi:hypothetical protein